MCAIVFFQSSSYHLVIIHPVWSVSCNCIKRCILPTYFRQQTWWRHQMETFSALLALCAGNSPVTGEFPHKLGQWHGAWCVFLICAWTNGCIINRYVCDLWRHRAHYDGTVINIKQQDKPMWTCPISTWSNTPLIIRVQKALYNFRGEILLYESERWYFRFGIFISAEITTWVSNYTLCLWDVITHPCFPFDGGLIKSQLKWKMKTYE